MFDGEIKHAEIEIIASRFSDKEKFSDGYKETTVTWLNSKCQVVSNGDIPIVGDFAIALGMIPELVRRARIDRSVDDISAWMRKRQEKSPYQVGNGLKQKYLTSLL